MTSFGETSDDPFDVEVQRMISGLSPSELPTARKGDGVVRLNSLAGDVFRTQLCGVALRELGRLGLPWTLRQRLRGQNADDVTRSVYDRLLAPSEGPRVGEEVAITGVGLMQAQPIGERTVVLTLKEGAVLFGAITGVAYGQYPSRSQVSNEPGLFNEAQVYSGEKVEGPLLQLSNVALCAVERDYMPDAMLDVAYVPFAEEGFRFHAVHPV
jgi:hypothetical protein